MTAFLTTISNFYSYQKKRFPVIVLGFSFLPAILSSGAVVIGSVNIEFLTLSLIMSLAYLLHVRIIDEFRDYEHDLEHHKDRPLSVGAITLNDLRIVDWMAIMALVLSALYSSLQALLIVVVMLGYSFLARNEFFLGLKFRKHFYLYNAVNLVQMLLLQVLVYTLASETFVFTAVVLIHFLFTATGTIIFEFLRKVNSPGNDGTGQDTYTWFLGLSNALVVYAVFAVVNILFFVKIILLIPNVPAYLLPTSIVLVFATFGTLLLNKLRKEEKTNQLMQLSFMIMYGGFNILIFLNV
jgi:4-hydroxybenzoate polyprenyltransferase